MTTTPQGDHEEVEPVTKETWTQRLTELAQDAPEADSEATAAALGAWLGAHVTPGHTRTGLRWVLPQHSRHWEVHATCGQCRQNSAAYQMGADPAVTPAPEPRPGGHD